MDTKLLISPKSSLACRHVIFLIKQKQNWEKMNWHHWGNKGLHILIKIWVQEKVISNEISYT